MKLVLVDDSGTVLDDEVMDSVESVDFNKPLTRAALAYNVKTAVDKATADNDKNYNTNSGKAMA